MGTHWGDPLTLPITLKKRRAGVVLETLQDAAEFMLGEFGNVTHSVALQAAIEELMRAADTGDAEDIRDATDLICRVLKFNELV